ncbi:PREDICTED: cysteine sulfinic acid decarboxylase [Corvus brachyrhynchos]|uniref:cysteine sulfinic acid decarboxylase n=1 Tax=Corvus brachyrhynchos TaxID=85066 RepID=UPI0008166EB0|nr:PREDICTED: cysteine sulfinic acid decarboxylase [Corvus brachyrhynchos]
MAEPSGIGDSIPLDDPGLDNTAGEEFLQEVFQILLEEGVRKSTDVTQKSHFQSHFQPHSHSHFPFCWQSQFHSYSGSQFQSQSNSQSCFHSQSHSQPHSHSHCGFQSRSQSLPVIPRAFPGHPRFFNQLFSGLDHHALAGRFLTETLNTSPYTYEVAPVLVLMEEQVLAKLRELVGWSSGDGIFAPGGSMSNMLAMNVARFQRFPESRSRGNWDLPRLALFASQESHYSIQKGAAFLGIGMDNVHLVRTDERGKMIPEELEKEIQRVKAEVGGGCTPRVPRAPQIPQCLPSIPSADSVTWNPHKLLMVGLQCSAFLLRDSSGLLQRCHGVGASYLFQRDKFYDVSLDTGDKSPQCGRRADGLKLWILWKAVGSRGLGRRVERAFAATRYLLEQVKRREGFQLVMEPEFLNLCFWFIPPSLRGQESSPEFWDKLGKVAPAIKEKMIRRGSMMVGYQPQGSRVNFFRQIVTNPAVTRQDLDFFLDEIQELGWDL